jgi:hypothetical protein
MLFAQQQNDAAFQFGMMIGIMFAIVMCASIPLVYGINRRHPVAGTVGAVFSGGTAFLFGCIGGLPMALVFVGIIACLPEPPRRRSREYEYDDYQDYHRHRGDDRPWMRGGP